MIIPVWLSDGSGNEMGKGHLGHRPSIITSIHSDDNGMTWERGDIVCRHDDSIQGNVLINPSETIPVQLNDSSVMLNIRSESEIDRRLIAVSPDGSSNWKIRGFDDALLEPVCMASIIKSNQDSENNIKDIVFINPDNLENNMIPPGRNLRHDRKRLTAKLSVDDAKTWSVSKVIEEGPSGYSDVAQLTSGEFICIYECEIVERICDDRYVRVTKFDKNWLKE
jgi:sialidase-1